MPEVIMKRRHRVPTSIAAAKQFTWVPTDSPPLILSPGYVKILVRRNCGHGGGGCNMGVLSRIFASTLRDFEDR
jgi:hypothetical protein